MIHITGDTHGYLWRLSSTVHFNGSDEWRKDDILIICGDFGFLNDGIEAAGDMICELEKFNYNICFCDGNHDNFPVIYSYPEEIWNGGRVHRIGKNIFHLMRGEIFEIENKKIFVMGGAYSIDKELKQEVNRWWSEELPTSEEYAHAIRSLDDANWCVDYIITHTAPNEITKNMVPRMFNNDAELTDFFNMIMHKAKFKKWFFGHWHRDEEINDQMRAIYCDVDTIE